MAKFFGKRKQKKAKKSPSAEDDSKAKESSEECPLGKCHLQVVVLRSDTDEGVENVTVKADPLGPQQTAKDTGLADFGEVEPKTYEVSLELDEDQKKQFEDYTDKHSVTVTKGATKRLTITLDAICELRILVLGYDSEKKEDKTIDGRDWELKEPVAESGKTKADPIAVTVLVEKEKAVLEVKLRDPPAAAAADPAVVTKPDDYPIKIKPDVWKDVDAEKVLPPREDDTVKWTLTVGDLADADTDEGAKGRLHNLAFPTDVGGEAAATQRAVKAYRLLYDDDRASTGALSTVKDAVKTRHDEA